MCVLVAIIVLNWFHVFELINEFNQRFAVNGELLNKFICTLENLIFLRVVFIAIGYVICFRQEMIRLPFVCKIEIIVLYCKIIEENFFCSVFVAIVFVPILFIVGRIFCIFPKTSEINANVIWIIHTVFYLGFANLLPGAIVYASHKQVRGRPRCCIIAP